MIRSIPGLYLLACLLLSTPLKAQNEVPVVAVASNLQFAIEVIADRFTQETGRELRLVVGSSGNLVRQIRSGAPFRLFLSADAAYVDNLYRDGVTANAGTEYARGRLALIVPAGSSLSPDNGLSGIRAALKAGELQRFAIPNPEHAPYGVRARQALQAGGLWASLQPLLVMGENVSQTAQFVASGNAQAGITAWSLALAEDVAESSRSVVLPASGHSPLRQRMVLLPGAGETAAAFFDYLLSPPAQAILRNHGFTVGD